MLLFYQPQCGMLLHTNINQKVFKIAKINFFLCVQKTHNCTLIVCFLYVSNSKRLPFDWRTPIGYLAAVFLQVGFTICPFQYIGCFMFLAFGAHMLVTAIIDIMNDQLRTINNMANRKKYRKDLYGKLCEFIRLHADFKQLSQSARIERHIY